MNTSFEASLVAQKEKRLSAVQETQVWSLGQEDALKKETATHSSARAWRIPRTEEPGRHSQWGLKEWDVTELRTLACKFQGNDIQPRELTKQDASTWLLRGSGEGDFTSPSLGWIPHIWTDLDASQRKPEEHFFFFSFSLFVCDEESGDRWPRKATRFPVPAGSRCSLASSSVALETWILTLNLLPQGHKMTTSASHLGIGPRKLVAPSDRAFPPVLSHAFCLDLVVWKQLMCQGWG